MKWLMPIALISLIACATSGPKTTNKEENNKENTPLLTKPVVRRIWIPDQILDGGKVYDQGHWRYLLEKETTWSK